MNDVSGLSLTVKIIVIGITVASALGAVFQIKEAWDKNWIISGNEKAVLAVTALVALLGFIQLLVDHRLQKLRETEEFARIQQIETLQAELRKEQSFIKSLSVLVNIHFFGGWDETDPPFSNEVYIAIPEHSHFLELTWENPGEGHQFLKFYGTKMYRFIHQGPGYQVFAVEASIKPSDSIIGKPLEVLKSIRGGAAYLPIVYPNKLKDRQISIQSVMVQLKLNGNKEIKFTHNTRQQSDIPEMRFVPVGIPFQGNEFAF